MNYKRKKKRENKKADVYKKTPQRYKYGANVAKEVSLRTEFKKLKTKI
jgi:hypothetical protein